MTTPYASAPSHSSVDPLVSGGLPEEHQIVVVHSEPRSIPKLSASLLLAFHLGVRSSFESALSAPVSFIENVSSITPELNAKRALLDVLHCLPTEALQDGMTLEIGVGIAKNLREFGTPFLDNLVSIALTCDAPAEALSHALRWTGRLRDPDSIHERALILTRALEANSAVVRDGASLGLVELGAAAVLPSLRAAVEREQNVTLRHDLQQVVEYLESKS